jgi:hypothetical protein
MERVLNFHLIQTSEFHTIINLEIIIEILIQLEIQNSGALV